MKVINVVGARPNFMKMAPIIEAMDRYPDRFQHLLVHTGQHYDERMSTSFFLDLGMPKPDVDLEVGSGSHAEQTARIMVEFEKVCLRERPDLVIVVGDVNSTMACAITAKKLGVRVAHVEAGLRSRDMSMPEEINRLCTDVLCDYLFTTDHFATENLSRKGIERHADRLAQIDLSDIFLINISAHDQICGRDVSNARYARSLVTSRSSLRRSSSIALRTLRPGRRRRYRRLRTTRLRWLSKARVVRPGPAPLPRRRRSRATAGREVVLADRLDPVHGGALLEKAPVVLRAKPDAVSQVEASERHRYIFAVRALPPLSVHSLAEAVSVQPLPLHSFFDLQELSAPEQEPWPLHSLMPAHFTTSVVFLLSLSHML